MKKLSVVMGTVLFTLWILSTYALATIITYDASSIGGDTWEYSYTVSDHVFNTGDSFEIVYEYGLYENIIDISHGADWSITAFDPVDIWGFVISGVYNGTSSIDDPSLVDPFVVQFDWLGEGTPGAQAFNVYASGSWMPIETGTTQSATAPIPEPSTAVLLMLGLSGLLVIKRKA